ncbi:MAG: universal stress protein [Planctomycetaceae bacterium]
MNIQRILALADLSENSRKGLRLADAFAARTGARVTVGYVHARAEEFRAFSRGDPENAKRLVEWAKSEDGAQLQGFAREGVDPLRLEGAAIVEAPSIREGIGTLLAQERPDLVCMATHGRTGLSHALVGSVAEQTLRTAGVPVAITRGALVPSPPAPLNVLFAVDLETEPEALVAHAGAWLTSRDTLHLAHVVESLYLSPADYGVPLPLPQPDVARLLEAVRRRLESITAREGGPRLAVHALSGRPADALLRLEAALTPDLVVARTHARRGFDRLLLGSVAESLVRRCASPVLVLPKPAD